MRPLKESQGAECLISAPFGLDINVQGNTDFSDCFNSSQYDEEYEALINGTVRELVEVLVEKINADPIMKLDEVKIDYEDSWVYVRCLKSDLDLVKDKLSNWVKEVVQLGSVEDEYTFELSDIEPPEIDAWDYGHDCYTTYTYQFADEDEVYDYYHRYVYVETSMTYDERVMEILEI